MDGETAQIFGTLAPYFFIFFCSLPKNKKMAIPQGVTLNAEHPTGHSTETGDNYRHEIK